MHGALGWSKSGHVRYFTTLLFILFPPSIPLSLLSYPFGFLSRFFSLFVLDEVISCDLWKGGFLPTFHVPPNTPQNSGTDTNSLQPVTSLTCIEQATYLLLGLVSDSPQKSVFSYITSLQSTGEVLFCFSFKLSFL